MVSRVRGGSWGRGRRRLPSLCWDVDASGSSWWTVGATVWIRSGVPASASYHSVQTERGSAGRIARFWRRTRATEGAGAPWVSWKSIVHARSARLGTGKGGGREERRWGLDRLEARRASETSAIADGQVSDALSLLGAWKRVIIPRQDPRRHFWSRSLHFLRPILIPDKCNVKCGWLQRERQLSGRWFSSVPAASAEPHGD